MALPLVVQGLMGCWVLEMIAVPILKWRGGARAERAGIMVGVLLQAVAVLAVLATTWPWLRVWRTAAVIIGLGWLVEFIGSHTGLPFGRYHYTARLQPQLGGVPLLIPLAWLMMLPPSWAVATLITGDGSRWLVALVTGLAFTAWDLFLDPQMVRWKFWEWEQPGGYFGIPWLNFVGWVLASTVMTAVVGPTSLPILPLFLFYLITWLLETMGQAVFWGLRGSALVGFLGMGLFVMLAGSFVLEVSMPALFWTVLGFFLGAMPFSVWIGRVALRTDIRAVGDGNPGATNVWRSGSKAWAAVAMLLDMLKGALPVASAYLIYGIDGWPLVPLALAPVLGHVFSPFLRGRGGKGVATTGGIWIGLTYGVATLVGAMGMSLAYGVQDVPFWAVAFGFACMGGYLVLVRPDPVLLTILLLNALLVLWRYRADLRGRPRLRWRKKA